MGCSFAYGDGLEAKDTVSSQIAKLTKRTVYNRAGRGWGLSQFLYLSRNQYFYKSIQGEPEYLIYIFIYDHINRIDKFKITPGCKDLQPKFRIKNGHLVEIKPNIIEKSALIQHIQYNYNYRFKKNDRTILLKYFKEAQIEFKKHWKDTKYIVLLYPICDGGFDNEFIDGLNELGYKTINLEKLSENKINLLDEKNKVDGWHPTANAWSILLPNVIKELNIK